MKKIKQTIKDFLKKIEKQNNQTFGTGKLDCCDLNKSKGSVNETNKENK